jgi:Protein of unknown function (DUF998)
LGFVVTRNTWILQIGVGVFVTDPIRSPASMTFHGTMHLVFGGAGFTALMAACFVFVRTFASLRQMRWAVFCAITGLLFLAGFLGAANASRNATSILFLNLIFVFAWVWVSAVQFQLMRNDLGPGNIANEEEVSAGKIERVATVVML